MDELARPRYVPALDGIRGIGLIGMLCYHADAPFARGAIFTISMFFTMSGFLITSLMLSERRSTGRLDLKAFWVRRFRRLLPAALITLAGVVVFGAVIADHTQRSNLRGDVLSALFYVANWRFIFSGQAYLNALSSQSPVLHFWSLAIEEQFYLLFPLVAFVIMGVRRTGGARRDFRSVRRRLGGAVVAMIAASVAVQFVFHLSQDRIYLGADTRAAEVLMGVLLAVVLARTPLGSEPTNPLLPRVLAVAGPIVLAVMVWSWIVVDEHSAWIYKGGFAAYSVLSAILVAAGAIPSNPVSRMLGVKPLAKLGRLSYGIYLYHWPLYLWLTPTRLHLASTMRLDPWFSKVPVNWQFWAVLAIRVSLTLVLAVLSHRFVEEPLRKGHPMFRLSLSRLAPVAATAVVISLLAVTAGVDTGTVGVAAAEADSLRVKAPSNADRSNAVPAGLRPVAAVGSSTTTTVPAAGPDTPGSTTTTTLEKAPPGGLPPLPIVRPKRKLRIMVVGDSTAVFLAFALAPWNAQHQIFELSSYAQLGCGIGRGGTEFSTGQEKTFAPTCATWPTLWAKGIAESKPDVIMVASGYHDATDRRLTPGGPWQHVGQPAYDDYLIGEYRAAADVLGTCACPVLWLTNPPVREGQNLPSSGLLNDPGNDPNRMVLLNGLVDRLAGERPFIHVVDYAKFFLTWPAGPYDPTLREDGMHVDFAGKAIVANWLGPELLAAYYQAEFAAPSTAH